MKTLRIFLQFLFVVANVVAVVLLIVSAYSDRVSPETSMTLSYLGLAFPVLCVVNLCFIIYWLFLWEWKFLLIGIFSFLLCWGPVKRYFPFHSHKDVPREEVLKVLTYNVMAFGYKNHTKIAPNKIIQYIANSDADIVCLQEYATAKSEKSLTASKIYDALSMYPYRSVFYQSSTKFQSFGIAVFSKYPLSNSRMVKYDSDYNGSSVHEVNIKGKKSVDSIHKELGHIMWEYVGMGRTAEGLKEGLKKLKEVRKEFEKELFIPGDKEGMNVELDKAIRLYDFITMGELVAYDALNRNESCGGHFREEYQTEEGEAKRDDENYFYVACWEYQGSDEKEPVLLKEPLVYEAIKVQTRNYKS